MAQTNRQTDRRTGQGRALDVAKVDELEAEIERQIRTGELVPGDRLVPVRALAAQRGVAPNTVAAVYKALAGRGLVHGEGRRGTFVSKKPAVRIPYDDTIPDHLIDMARGNPDPTLFPDLRRALAGVPSQPVLYGNDQIIPELDAAFRSAFEVDGVDAAELAVVAGALDGIERVLSANLRPGDQVAVEDPGYSAVVELVTAMGFRPIPVPVDGEGPVPAALESAIEEGAVAVIVTPRAQNPTGCAVSPGRANRLRQILRKQPDVFVIEDDHAGPIAGFEYHSVVPPTAERWAVVRSVAKSLGPDLRVSALVGDSVTVARVRGRQALGTGWVSHILQHVVAAMLNDPDYDQTVSHAAQVYRHRRDVVRQRLAQAGIDCTSVSGLNVWIPVRDEASVVAAMERRGYVIRSGAYFRINAEPGVRMTIAGHDLDELGTAADTLAEVLTSRAPVRGV